MMTMTMMMMMMMMMMTMTMIISLHYFFLFSGSWRPWLLMPERQVSLRDELGDTERFSDLALRSRSKSFDTDSWSKLPGFQEMVADSSKFDVAGNTWGNDAHWPLHITIGTGRFRGRGMRTRRYLQKKIKGRKGKAPSDGEGSGEALRSRSKSRGSRSRSKSRGSRSSLRSRSPSEGRGLKSLEEIQDVNLAEYPKDAKLWLATGYSRAQKMQQPSGLYFNYAREAMDEDTRAGFDDKWKLLHGEMSLAEALLDTGSLFALFKRIGTDPRPGKYNGKPFGLEHPNMPRERKEVEAFLRETGHTLHRTNAPLPQMLG